MFVSSSSSIHRFTFSFFVVFIITTTQLGHVNAQCKNPCQPWADNSCTRRTGKIDIRWGLTLPSAPVNTTLNCSEPINNYVAYGFCAGVDELQAFQLNYSSIAIAVTRTAGATGPATPETTMFTPTASNLFMFGSGSQPTTHCPGPTNYSNVLVYEGQSDQCSQNGNGGPAIVTMLIYNMTLKSGTFSYDNGIPVGVGFMPTCGTDDVCIMDPSLICIGEEGRKNCGVCLQNVTDVFDKDLNIFTVYYGTDSKGKTLTSGSSNPLNFRAFAMGNAYNKISGDLASANSDAKNANPFKDVDEFSLEGLGKTKLSTDVPNNAIPTSKKYNKEN